MTKLQSSISYPYKLEDIAWLMGTYADLKEDKAKPTVITIYRQLKQEFLDKALEVYTVKDRDLYVEHYIRFVALAHYFPAVPMEHLLTMVNLWDRLRDHHLVTELVTSGISISQLTEAETELDSDGSGLAYEHVAKLLIIQQAVNSVTKRMEERMPESKPLSPVSQELFDEIGNFIIRTGDVGRESGQHTFMSGLWGHDVLRYVEIGGSSGDWTNGMLRSVLQYHPHRDDPFDPNIGINLLIQLLLNHRRNIGMDNQRRADDLINRLMQCIRHA